MESHSLTLDEDCAYLKTPSPTDWQFYNRRILWKKKSSLVRRLRHI